MITKKEIKCTMVISIPSAVAPDKAGTYTLTGEGMSFLEQFMRNPGVTMYVYLYLNEKDVYFYFHDHGTEANFRIWLARENVADPLIWDHVPKSVSTTPSMFRNTMAIINLDIGLNWLLQILRVVSPTPCQIDRTKAEGVDATNKMKAYMQQYQQQWAQQVIQQQIAPYVIQTPPTSGASSILYKYLPSQVPTTGAPTFLHSVDPATGDSKTEETP